MIFTSIAGALFNRILGGGFDQLNQDKLYTAILQALGGTLVCMLAFFVTFLVVGHAEATIGITAVMATLGMYGGSTWGWGSYIGALGGWQSKPLGEVSFIDALTRKIEPTAVKVNQHTVRFDNTKKLRLWGFVSMTLRGALWGACVSAGILLAWIICKIFGFVTPTLTILPVIGGLGMGAIYLLCIEIARALWANPGRGWPLAEWAFGAWFWVWCLRFV